MLRPGRMDPGRVGPHQAHLCRRAAPAAFRLLGVLAIAVAVAVTCVRIPVGRRVAGLMATGLLPSLAVTIPPRDVAAGVPVLLLAWLLGAVLVWPVAIVSWRGRAERRRRLAERAWDAWQAGRYRRGEISQWPGYSDNPFRPR